MGLGREKCGGTLSEGWGKYGPYTLLCISGGRGGQEEAQDGPGCHSVSRYLFGPGTVSVVRRRAGDSKPFKIARNCPDVHASP